MHYLAQRATDSTFTSGVFTSPLLTAFTYTFDLPGDGLYYYRVRSQDGLGHTLGWSAPVSSTQDGTPPLISGLSAAPDPFSPQVNSLKDVTTLSAQISETNLSGWTLTILSGSQTVRTFNGSGLSVSQTWDGHNVTGTTVADGLYTVRLLASDLAGNQAISQTLVEVDNTPPDGEPAHQRPACQASSSTVAINDATGQAVGLKQPWC